MCVDEIRASGKRSLISGPFGSNISSKYFVDDGIPVIRGNNLSLDVGTKFRDDEFVYVTDEKADELNTWASKDDLIFTAVGTIGQVGILTGGERYVRYVISNKQIRLTLNTSVVAPLFAYYWFASDVMVDQVVQRNTGSSVPLINLAVVKSLLVPVPSIPEQEAIIAALSSLDDKIDLLQRQNKTLEAMVETLFRQWFVEEAQEDWEEGKIEDLFILQRGFDLPAQDRIDGPYPIYAASGKSGGHVEYKVKGPGVTTGRSGLLGKVFLVLEDFWPLNTSLYVKEFKRGTPLFSYFFLKTLDLGAFNAGSAVPTLNRNHVHGETVLLPPMALIAQFEETAWPLLRKIKQNESQISSLEKLRDTLLPKLMSGEVRVAYADSSSVVSKPTARNLRAVQGEGA